MSTLKFEKDAKKLGNRFLRMGLKSPFVVAKDLHGILLGDIEKLNNVIEDYKKAGIYDHNKKILIEKKYLTCFDGDKIEAGEKYKEFFNKHDCLNTKVEIDLEGQVKKMTRSVLASVFRELANFLDS